MRILSLILAGGKGERFWPLSRKNKPKQLLDLFTGKPLILEAYERAKLFGEVYIITTQELQKQIKQIIYRLFLHFPTHPINKPSAYFCPPLNPL